MSSSVEVVFFEVEQVVVLRRCLIVVCLKDFGLRGGASVFLVWLRGETPVAAWLKAASKLQWPPGDA
jgi:hypothetical protein